jgi:hypothetical protein
MSDLRTDHKTLIFLSLLLAIAMMVWGVVNRVYRHEPDAIAMLILGAVTWPVALMYFIRVYRNPPTR